MAYKLIKYGKLVHVYIFYNLVIESDLDLGLEPRPLPRDREPHVYKLDLTAL